MKRFAILSLFCVLASGLSAQINRYGTFVTKSYSMQLTGGAEFNWCITKDKFGAVYFGNDDNLVIRYDGSKWATIPLSKDEPTIARSLGADENGIIYVGGINEFGYIEPDSTGKRVYVSMTTRISSAKDVTFIDPNDSLIAKNVSKSDLIVGEIKSLVVKGSLIYFLSPTALIIYKSDIDSLEFINLKKLGFRNCERLFYINDKLILTSNNTGLFELKDGRLLQLPGGDFFSRKICLSILPYDKDNLIVGTLDTGIFLYNFSDGTVNNNFLDQETSNKLKELYIYCGVRLQSGEIIFGTTTDGLYVINEKGSCISHLSSKNTNMQDNAIRALFTDPNSNSELWISTTGSLTKAYTNLPFTEFSEKDGLDGSVNNFCMFNGSIYVATDKGLFKSVTEKDGVRRFENFNDINSQIFPLCVGTVAKDSFLLAGSTFDGVFFISSSGKSESISVTQDPSRVIIQSKFKKNRFYVGMTYAFVNVLEYNKGIWKNVGHIRGLSGAPSYINELRNGDLLILTSYSEGLFRLSFNDTIPVKYSSEKGIPETGLNSLNECNGEFFLTTSSGIYKLNKETDTWSSCNDITGGYSINKNIDYYYVDNDGDKWISSNEERYYDIMFRSEGDSLVMNKGGALSILTNLKFQNTNSIDGRVWLAKSISISIINKEKLNAPLPFVQTLLTKIIVSTHGADSLVMDETFFRKAKNGRRYPLISNFGEEMPEFKYTYNSPSFYWTTPYMIQEGDILYSYKLEGFEDEWSKWDKVLYKDFTNLSFGKYTFKVKAKTVTGLESGEAAYSFVILKPWYLTPLMIILYVIAAILLIFGIITAYTRRLKSENIRLEGIVAERTAVVVKQKEELESSIHYASRIQMALLPSEAILSENIKNYFVLFKPRDIVSGDFYWMTKKGDRLYIVAADCTGHGVPGAFMSLLGMSFLDEIIDKEFAPRADFILNQLRLHVTDSLKQVGGDDEAKDGMDMALLVIDFKTKRIEFSGAYNPCFRVRKLSESEIKNFQDDSSEMPDGSMSNGKYLLETIYASKMPIGISSRMNEDFVFYDWNLERGISYYLFSDGYIDQFGGEHGRKFMKKNFKKLILEIQDYPMNKQKEILDKNLKDWMGHSPQIDDILVMGIRTE